MSKHIVLGFSVHKSERVDFKYFGFHGLRVFFSCDFILFYFDKFNVIMYSLKFRFFEGWSGELLFFVFILILIR